MAGTSETECELRSEVGYEPGDNLIDLFNRVNSHFFPIIKAELDKSKWFAEVANRAEKKRKLNLQELIDEALICGAAKLKKRSDALSKLQDFQEYSSSVEIVRWFEEQYLPNLDRNTDPQAVKDAQKKLYEEQKAKLDKIEQQGLEKTTNLEAAVYSTNGNGYRVVGIPIFADYKEEDENSLVRKVYDFFARKLREVSFVEERADQSGKLLAFHLTHMIKSKDAALCLREIAESDYLKKLNVAFSVFDARLYLKNELCNTQEKQQENELTIVRPDTLLTVRQAAQILGMSEKGVRGSHYRDNLMVANPNYDTHSRRDSTQRIKYFYSGEKFHKFVRDHGLNAKCRFEGFNNGDRK